MTDDQRKEFSTREAFGGRIVLRVKCYERFASSGEWRDAEPRDLPEFYRRLLRPDAAEQRKEEK